MIDDLREQLANMLGRPITDPLLDQLLPLLREHKIKDITTTKDTVQPTVDIYLEKKDNLISFEGAAISDGLTIGDVAGGDLIKVNIAIPQSQDSQDKELRLKAMLADHRSFIRARLENFVGRKKELTDIQQHIREKIMTGGYVTITGQAGQGKSSIIAKLVEEYGTENVAFHFIPFNPGPDHQVELLRNLMARLILKYNLSDLYVASESRPALRNYFPKVLGDLVAKGGQEVIFIDGLDQLEEELSGTRDLSFLPNNPPPGVVFVLGTRPNDTLKPLELLKPHDEYKLPNLSRNDFDLILKHRNVQVGEVLADRFYKAMQENALYLDLVAKELAELHFSDPLDVIDRVSSNPDFIFSLSINRLKRQEQQWHMILKPTLGLLLAAAEPLGSRHIRQILSLEDDDIRSGLRRLGGLVAEDGKGSCYLFHLKLQDYLREDKKRPNKEYIFSSEEELLWHKKLINWCELSDLELNWQDMVRDSDEQFRRVYSRQHYILHLYRAKLWKQLFNILDKVNYGQAKLKFDPSTRSYSQDLELGRQTAIWEEWTTEEGIAMLPRLWQYTLLLNSLNIRVDQYTLEAFEALMSLKRERAAIELAELITKQDYKARVILYIAKQIGKQAEREHECYQLIRRSIELVHTIENSWSKSEVLGEIGVELLQLQKWDEAELVITSIQDNWMRARALHQLSNTLVREQQWNRAKKVIRSIEESGIKAEALHELGLALIKAQQWDKSEAVLNTINQGWIKPGALRDFARAFIQAHQWKRAEEIIHIISDSHAKAEILYELGTALAHTQHWVQAETIIHSIEVNIIKVKALCELGLAFTLVQQWLQAENVWGEAEAITHSIVLSERKAEALCELGRALAQAQQLDRAIILWKQALEAINSIERNWIRNKALHELVLCLATVQQWDRAEAVIGSIEFGSIRTQASHELVLYLAQAQQWDRAEKVIQNGAAKVETIHELFMFLAQAQQWDRAEKVILSIKDPLGRIKALCDLNKVLTKSQQWDRALVILDEIKDLVCLIQKREDRIKALRELSISLVQAQRWQQAESTWNELLSLISGSEDQEDKTEELNLLALTLIYLQQWEQAKTVILSVKDKVAKSEKLRELSNALAQMHKWEEAQAVINLIEDRWVRVQSLREFGTTLLRFNQWKQAEAVIRSIEENENKIKALYELAIALVRTQRWKQAQSVIDSIKISSDKADALCKLGIALNKFGYSEQAEAAWNEAEAVVHSLVEGANKAKALRDLGIALARAQRWKQAQSVIDSIKEKPDKAEALSELGLALTVARLQEQAEAAWNEAEAVVHSLVEGANKAKALRDLGIALARAQRWKQAQSVIDSIKEKPDKTWSAKDKNDSEEFSIDSRSYKSEALCELALELAKAQQLNNALSKIRSLKEFQIRARALRKLSTTLTQLQGWEQVQKIWIEANDVTNTIVESVIKAEELHELTRALVNVQRWDEAEKVARSINVNEMKSEALDELANALIKAEKWEQAIEVIFSIDKSAIKVETLHRLSTSLIMTQQMSLARKVCSKTRAIAETIKESKQRIKLLKEVVEILAAIGEYEQALHLVQQTWLQTHTREDAIDLITLATPLIHFKPEIAPYFYEAYTWVNILLKG